MAISRNDYKNKYGNQIEEYRNQGALSSTKTTTDVSSAYKNYKTKAAEKKSAINQLQQTYKNNGVVVNKNSLNPTTDNSVYANSQLNRYDNVDNLLNSKSKAAELTKGSIENQKKYKELTNSDTVKKLKENIVNKYNETASAYLDYENKKLAKDNIGLYDKTIGSLIGGMTSPFSQFTTPQAVNENGDLYYVSDYNSLKNQKVLDSYSDTILGTVGKIGSSALYEGGKIITSAVLNKVLPGLGTAEYYTDLYTKQLNSAIAEGYDESKSLAYATLGTATEVVTGKLLGGTTKLIFGGESSELSQIIGKNLSKLISNPRIVNAISNGISEGSEEFVQEYLDRLSRNIIFSENNKVLSKDTFSDAMYSAAVGALTGAASGALDNTDYSKLQENDTTNEELDAPNAINNKPRENIVQNENINQNNQVNIPNENISINNNTNVDENTDIVTSNNTNNNIDENTGLSYETIQNQIEELRAKRQKTTDSNQIQQIDNQINTLTSQTNDIIEDLNNQIEELENSLNTNKYSFQERIDIKNQITELENQQIAYENGYSNYNDYLNSKNTDINLPIAKDTNNVENVQTNNSVDEIKQQQLDIINKSNPFPDDVHTWIRSIDDVKSFTEAYFEDGEYSGMDPDFTESMAQEALETGKITVYSSYPIENGVFVSPSKMEASQYAGGDASKLYSKEVNINDVAWIDGAEGQYASVSNNKINLDISKINSDFTKKELNLIEKELNISKDFIREINYKTSQNMKSYENVKMEQIDNLLSLYTGGGYRTANEFIKLIKGIKQDGITEPIRLVINNNKIVEIDNGNHRLFIANKFGLKEVPVIYISDLNLQSLDANLDIWYNYENEVKANEKEFNSIDETSENGSTYNQRSNETSQNRNTNERNNGIYPKIQNDNNQSSNETVYSRINQQELEDSSFKLPINNDIQNTQNNTTSNNNLTTSEIEELNTLKITEDKFGLNEEEQSRYDYLTNKSKGLIKYPDLKTNNTFDDIKTAYGLYKNLSNFDSSLVNQAEDLIQGYRNTGKRTKEQWLSIAEYIGNNIDTTSSEDLTKYAIQSWFYTKPNTKDNLNRQGNSYVKFSVDEWVNAVYNGAGVGTINTTSSITNNLPISKDNQINSNKVNLPMAKSDDVVKVNTNSLETSNTIPSLPNIDRNVNNDGESKFYNNIKDKTNMLTDEQKKPILSEDEVKYYDRITNKETLNEAYDKLSNDVENEPLTWFGKESKTATAVDVAEGWILLKQYADNNDTDGMVAVAKKMRDIGTKAGQTVQAFNIMERMTPEGMVKYAQSELLEAYDKMSKNKSKEWIDKYKNDFDLKPEEVQLIMNNMQDVQTMKDGYEKKVKLAEIQKVMTDKLPSTKGDAIKSWMRISMLFNPKTQVRNVAGNAIIAPVNYFGDMFSSYADKLISKKTGVRTTGNINIKAILKGLKEGAYQATNDYKNSINTKDMDGNRFEIGDGKSFTEKTLIGKSLNRVEGLLNYVMDVGDRVFSQSSFENSLQNQMVLNNTTEATQEMIDIARTESLQRTWNDNNNYTKFVLDIRKGLNKIGVDGYGLGDILIPFAKTPANLTKAIVDYSPAGLVNTLIEGNNLRKSLNNGQYTAQMQHKFVQDLGKATAGTMLYVLGYALAKSGVISGESDDDKDTANFLKNTLGISSYSIKIGDKSFTYDWAQPIAAPLSIMSNVVNSKNKNTALLEAVVGSLDTAGSILMEQSFLESLNDVFTDNDGPISGLINEILELPSRAVPTFSKQIADLVDGTQRTSYEYGKPLQSAINSIKAKIPGLSKTLSPTVDTLGREVQKYGGKNNIFNVFLNPANVNTENISSSAEEIYRLYKSTGQSDIMPRVAPYYINQNGEKTILSSSEKAEYQKISGNIIEESVQDLLKNKQYQNLSDDDKADIINSIVNYSYNKAREEVLGIEMSSTYNKINEYVNQGGNVSNYYLNKEEINYSLENPAKYSIITQITSYDKYQSYKKELEAIRNNSDSKKTDTINYINSLNLNIAQKAMFIKQYYSSFDNYNQQIIEYVNKQDLTKQEKTDILTQLGFTIRDWKVY